MELKQLHSNEKDFFIAFAESRIGGRGENQDSYLSKSTERGFVVTVCDGMGGGPGGKTASTIAVNEIIAGIDEANKDEESANVIIKAIRRANMAIIEAGNENPQLKGMGSTATVLLLTEESAYVAHVGDSRIYQLRGRKKVFRTFDHSMVFDLVRQKVITEEQARLSAQSNVITRALGVKPDVEVDIQEVPYLKGDRFLLCSDGIHGTMPEEELIRLATEKGKALGPITDNIATIVDELGRREGGGHDNLTLALIETRINSKLKPKMSKQTKLMLMLLGALAAISIVFNVVQCASKPDTEELTQQVEQLQKEVTAKTDSIKSLTDTIAKKEKDLKAIQAKVNIVKQAVK
ncbi:protein phosphatase 2C domain-containing protein [uncultured Prevotella sp.]|uniref:PP2C family protein-serine/threonine phosphatase n=1 Tax=uncultured Prevotella sp. TaxID=159272 RepID=UPI0025DE9EC0|nr:protein phosphatase 2C domain-containing protein [uncultured Prevotella sp.]